MIITAEQLKVITEHYPDANVEIQAGNYPDDVMVYALSPSPNNIARMITPAGRIYDEWEIEA